MTTTGAQDATPLPARSGRRLLVALGVAAALVLLCVAPARRIWLTLRAPALLHVDDLDEAVAAADRLMAAPAGHGFYGTRRSLGEPPSVDRPLSTLPAPLRAARPEWVRVDAHEVVLSWPDGLGRGLTVFSDDDEGRRRAAALRDAPWSYTARLQVHPRAWASHGVH